MSEDVSQAPAIPAGESVYQSIVTGPKEFIQIVEDDATYTSGIRSKLRLFKALKLMRHTSQKSS